MSKVTENTVDKAVMCRVGGFKRTLVAIGFLLSSVAAAGVMVACDSGNGTLPPTQGTLDPLASGQRVYAQYCNSCHPGGDMGAGPALKPTLPTLSDEQIRTIVRNGKRPMPSYNQNTISDDQLTSLILYMRTLK